MVAVEVLEIRRGARGGATACRTSSSVRASHHSVCKKYVKSLSAISSGSSAVETHDRGTIEHRHVSGGSTIVAGGRQCEALARMMFHCGTEAHFVATRDATILCEISEEPRPRPRPVRLGTRGVVGHKYGPAATLHYREPPCCRGHAEAGMLSGARAL